MANKGTATIDFGSFPGQNEASVVVGDTGITAGVACEAYFQSDLTTADHSANDHRWLPRFVSLTAGEVVAGSGFTIRAVSEYKIIGTFKVAWVYA